MIKKKLVRFTSVMIISAMAAGMTACGGKTTVDSELSMAQEVQAYIETVDEEYAYGIAETLAYDENYLSNELGWRTAGSDAEHAAADYLASEMESLGLEEIEKVPVTVDKWQFNDASLTIEGSDINIMPASYATNGTDSNGITAEIVDVGDGFSEDYDGKDLNGKIALVGVDQWNVAWIDQYMNEAALHGASAIVSYSKKSGYAAFSDDMINMQDLCAEDVIPCVSISRNQYKEIKKAIKDGKTTATLKVDNEMVPEGGTSYNVIGKIKGKSSDQQIIVSGHYDVYFNGFQDDSCAIGLVLAMAKGMKESGYVPMNDIIFVCHGSEEWGAIGTQFDWTTGAWEMINNAHPEWAGKTLAMINFEMPAVYDGAAQTQIQCEPEFASMAKNFVETSGLALEPVNDVYPEGINSESVDTHCLEDGVSYRASGVPHFINVPGFDKSKDTNWNRDRYHTAADDKDTYNEDVMLTNLNMFGALAIYVDKTPALQLDMVATCDDLEEALDENLAKEAGADAEAYKAALADLRNKAEAWNEKIADINSRYEEAVAAEASEEEINEIIDEAKAVNKLTLEAFKYVQDNFIGIVLTSDIVIKHDAYQRNINTLSGVISALEEGNLSNEKEGNGALDLAYAINGGSEFSYYKFSKETAEASLKTLQEETNPDNVFWGTGKGYVLVDTSEATMSLLKKVGNGDKSFDTEIKIYEEAKIQQLNQMKISMEKETAAMKGLADMLK